MRTTPAAHRAMLSGPTSAPLLRVPVEVKAGPDGRLDDGRRGLSTRRLHDLTDEESDGLRLPPADIRDRVGVRGQDGIDRWTDHIDVRDLAEAALGDDRRDGAAARGMHL